MRFYNPKKGFVGLGVVVRASAWAALITGLTACGSAHLRSDLVDPARVHSMQSVLVVPLQNLSGAAQAEHAVADEVAARLRFYPNLVVREMPWLQLQLRKLGIPLPESRDPNTVAALARQVGVDAVLTGAVYEYGFFREQRSVSDHVVVGLRLDLYDPHDTRLIWSGSSGHSMGNELSSYRPILSEVASDVVASLLEDMFERTEAYLQERAQQGTVVPGEISQAVTPAVAAPETTPTVYESAPAPISESADVRPATSATPVQPDPVEPPDSASEQDGGIP